MTQQEYGAEQHPSDRARQALEHDSGETADVFSFWRHDPRYKVPGRTRDGDRKDDFGPILRIFFAILDIVTAPARLLDKVLNPLYPFEGKRIRITGPAGCAALTPADAVQKSEDSVFLVWSASHVALVACELTAPARIVWQASHPQRPAFDPATGVMSWPDGSRIDFAIPRDERKRFQQSNAHQ